MNRNFVIEYVTKKLAMEILNKEYTSMNKWPFRRANFIYTGNFDEESWFVRTRLILPKYIRRGFFVTFFSVTNNLLRVNTECLANCLCSSFCDKSR